MMYIRKSLSRLVIVVPLLGMAIKLPIIHWIIVLKSLFWDFRHFSLPGHYFKHDVDTMWSFRWHLFKGMADNWREFRFYRQTKNPFLQPTYISIFGLLNIQKAGEPCGLSMDDLWVQVRPATMGDAENDGHHFVNPRNFCRNGNKVRILDYGSPKTQKIVEQYGIALHDGCDPNYKREKGEA